MPVKYVPFIPEPVAGQAVLANFNRVLRYQGADDASLVLQRGMPLYEMGTRETVGEDPGGNMVIQGECVSACAYLKEQGIQVDLVYIDPPFASGADYAKKIYLRRNPRRGEAAAQAGREVDAEDLRTFEEKMYGDVWDKEKYLNWMYENLMAIKSVMSPRASLYVHLDWHIGHYVKILLDEIFGEDAFLNEIVWCYSIGGKGERFFGRKHDTIYLYTPGPDHVFHGSDPLVTTARKENSHMRVKTDGDGRTYQEKTDKKSGKVYRYYVDQGKIPEDYWTDIEQLNREDAERECAYATQKPEKLLQRIIAASSDPGMYVADFFGGSGVAAAVAHRLGRRFIHCDVGLNSVQTARDRLRAGGASFDVLEIRDGVQLYRNPVQTMERIKTLLPGLRGGDAGPFWAGTLSDSRLGPVPVYLPNLADSASKLLDTVQISRILHQAIPELDPAIRKVIVYYIDITSEAEIRQCIADDDSTAVEVELRDLKALLDGVYTGDQAEFHLAASPDGYTVSLDRFCSDRVLQKLDAFNEKARLSGGVKKPFQPVEASEEGLELIEWVSVDCTAAQGPWHADSEVKIDRLGYAARDGVKTETLWDGTIRCGQRPLRLKIRNICGDETEWAVDPDGTPEA